MAELSEGQIQNRKEGEPDFDSRNSELTNGQLQAFENAKGLDVDKTSRNAELRPLSPSQVLRLASSEESAKSLISNPGLLSAWVDAYLNPGRKAKEFNEQLEKFLLPAFKDRLNIPLSETDQDQLRFENALIHLSRIKRANPGAVASVISTKTILELASSEKLRVPSIVLGNWFKDAGSNEELDFTLNWLKARMKPGENQNSRISQIAAEIPHKECRQLFLDYQLQSDSGFKHFQLERALSGLDADSVAELMKKNLNKFPDRTLALASALASLPPKQVNTYLEEIEKSKSVHFLKPLHALVENYGQFAQDLETRKRLEKIYDDISEASLQTIRQVLKTQSKLSSEQLDVLGRSPLLSDRQAYLKHYYKWETLNSWTFADATRKLNTQDKLALLDLFSGLLEPGQKGEVLKSLKALQVFKESGKLREALENKLQAIEKEPVSFDHKRLELPESNLEQVSSPKEKILKFLGTETETARRLRPGLKPPLTGWKYKDGEREQLFEQLTEPYERELNVYSFMHGGHEVRLRIDKAYDQELDQLRESKQKLGSNPEIVSFGQSRKSELLLPEQIVSLVQENLPATGHLKVLELAKDQDPIRFVQPERPRPGQNPVTVAAADANSATGRVRIFINSKFGFLSNLKHEYKHLLEKEAGFKTYQEAIRFEASSWQAHPYGSTNDSEDWAVNGGERGLGKDGSAFMQFVRHAPARAIASLAVLEQSMNRAQNLTEAQKQALAARVEYVEAEALPRFQKQIEESIETNNFNLLKQQISFLLKLTAESHKPAWTLKVLQSPVIQKLFTADFSEQISKSQLSESILALATIHEPLLDGSLAGSVGGLIDRELPKLRSKYVTLSKEQLGLLPNQDIVEFLRNAVSLRNINPKRGIELISDAEFVNMLAGDYTGRTILEGWYQAAKAEGKSENLLSVLAQNEVSSQLLLYINDPEARLKFARTRDRLYDFHLRNMLDGLDTENKSIVLDRGLQYFSNSEEALDYNLSLLPPSWQLKHIERIKVRRPSVALMQLQLIIDQAEKSDPDVLKEAKAAFMLLRPQIIEAVMNKLQNSDQFVYSEDVDALRYSDSLQARALYNVLKHDESGSHYWGHKEFGAVVKGLKRAEQTELLALHLAKHYSFNFRGKLELLANSLEANNLDQDLRTFVDIALQAVKGRGKTQSETKALAEGRVRDLLEGDALATYFKSSWAVQKHPDIPLAMVQLVGLLDPGPQTDELINKSLLRKGMEIKKALESEEFLSKKNAALLELAYRFWQADPRLGALLVSPDKALSAFQSRSYLYNAEISKWLELKKIADKL